ncbi:hypothetical protein HNQ08_004376 [Deinococcus humi]|uniref:Uncharacterized protein n=1 Tax=Deinococcus humi TaxID=662880 RepID=A0A7W8JXY9_9DEIO|nr:hypothetical protein [Deinococcus humi]
MVKTLDALCRLLMVRALFNSSIYCPLPTSPMRRTVVVNDSKTGRLAS